MSERDDHPDATREKLLALLQRVCVAYESEEWAEGETLESVMSDVYWAVGVSDPLFGTIDEEESQ